MTESYDSWLKEQELREQTVEIVTIQGDKHARALSDMGIDTESDAEGIIVNIKSKADKKKVREYLMKNGWDRRDIKDGYPELV